MAYVLARTGVLMSDPRVASMTAAQWQFQYEALRAYDDDVLEVVVESVRTMGVMMRDALIGVLGLDKLAEPDAPGAPPRPYGAPPPFLPGVFVLGDVKMANKLATKVAETTGPATKRVDDAFEDFSAKLHARLKAGQGDGFGDIEPFDEDGWTSPEAEAELAMLGIADRPPPTDDEPDDTIHLAARPKAALGGDGLGFGVLGDLSGSALAAPLTAQERVALGMPPVEAGGRRLASPAGAPPHVHDDGPPRTGIVYVDDDGAGDPDGIGAAPRPGTEPVRLDDGSVQDGSASPAEPGMPTRPSRGRSHR